MAIALAGQEPEPATAWDSMPNAWARDAVQDLARLFGGRAA
ncbi:hypothetical protein [Falsiroseomonas sp. E2-1-a20]